MLTRPAGRPGVAVIRPPVTVPGAPARPARGWHESEQLGKFVNFTDSEY
jgi:hypothetical protein